MTVRPLVQLYPTLSSFGKPVYLLIFQSLVFSYRLLAASLSIYRLLRTDNQSTHLLIF
jgi:hypothetical protein